MTADEPNLVQKLTAEVIGTCFLVVIGCGSVAVFTAAGGAGFVTTTTTVALAFGLAIVLGAYSFGRISGGHFNPAVSAGAALSGRMSWMEAGYYMIAQVVGAIVGAFLLFIITLGFDYNSFEDGGVGANSFGDDGSGIDWWAAGILELVLTAIFVFVILAVTDKRNDIALLAPLAIGLALSAVHFVGIPGTGTSVNPARSLGPALFSGGDAMAQVWLFLVFPFLGGLLAGIAYPALFGRDAAPVPGSGFTAPQPKAQPQAQPGGWGPDQGQAPQGQQGWSQDPGWGGQAQQGQSYAPPAQPSSEPSEQTQARPSWQTPQQPAGEGELPVYEQDGWRWDYAKQEWVPIEDQQQ